VRYKFHYDAKLFIVLLVLTVACASNSKPEPKSKPETQWAPIPGITTTSWDQAVRICRAAGVPVLPTRSGRTRSFSEGYARGAAFRRARLEHESCMAQRGWAVRKVSEIEQDGSAPIARTLKPTEIRLHSQRGGAMRQSWASGWVVGGSTRRQCSGVGSTVRGDPPPPFRRSVPEGIGRTGCVSTV
jgi:hypothetical protein